MLCGVERSLSGLGDFFLQNIILKAVVGQSSSVLKLLSGEDESLLLRGNSLLVLDLGLDILDQSEHKHKYSTFLQFTLSWIMADGVVGLDIQGDRLTGEGLDEDLHRTDGNSQTLESFHNGNCLPNS